MSQEADLESGKGREEFAIFVERFMHFMNLWTVYRDLLSGHYAPTVGSPTEQGPFPNMTATLIFALYAWFYSLIEDGENAVNAFRVWRVHFPEDESAISVVEAQVIPFAKSLKIFRNRLGSHGSRSRAHESSGFDLFEQHSGYQMLDAMRNFKALGAALLDKDLQRQKLKGQA